MPETIVLGLDGANWSLLEPWLEDDTLPNIQSLRESGVDADMESCLPPVTCPNWRCYSTGKNPGKLGVYWWEKIDTNERTLSTPTSRSFKSANYWNYLNEDGKTAGIMNLPMTYPPLDIDGYMIAGGPGSEQDAYTNPTELETELNDRGYRLHPEVTLTSKDDRRAAESVVDLIDDRLATFRDLLAERDVDIAHCTVFYINVLQHYFWRDDPTREAWRRIDDHVGSIREEYPDATLYLMSDHGCAEIDTMFYANSWLEREGYLQTTRDASDALGSLGVNKQTLAKWTDKVGIRDIVASVTPEFVKQRVPEDDEGAKREQKLERIQWEDSEAVASGQGLIYVFGEGRTRESLIDDLEQLDSKITGTPIAGQVYRREEAYEGPYVEDAPEIVFDQTPGIHTSGAIGNNPVFENVSHWRAENVRTGLFLVDGPAVEDNATVDEPISITDIAPTILHETGTPIPEDVDGEPLRLFGRPEPDYREPITPDFVDERADEAVQDRLEGLGYLQ